MCLLDTRRFRFTLKKIPVYKVVVERDTHYRSPYMGGFISKGLPFIQKGNLYTWIFMIEKLIV